MTWDIIVEWNTVNCRMQNMPGHFSGPVAAAAAQRQQQEAACWSFQFGIA